MPNLINESEPLDWEWLTTPHASPQFKWVIVSPEQCRRINDELNPANRPLRPGRVEFWQRLMKKDRWKFTHQGVAFTVLETTEGEYVVQEQDGQHRFEAAAREGISLECLMAVGMPPENFGVIDVGASRTGKDTLATLAHDPEMTMYRSENDNVHNGAIRLVRAFEFFRGEVRQSIVRFKVTNDELKPLTKKYGIGLTEAVNEAERIRRKTESPGMSSIALAAAMFSIRQVLTDEDDILKFKEFLRGYSDGTMLTTGDSRIPLRSFMSNLKDQNNKKVPVVTQFCVFIKAWNKWATGEASSVLSYRKDETLQGPFKPSKAKNNQFQEGMFSPVGV